MEPPECSICMDIFGNSDSHIRCPKILKCGDSFCKECLKDIIKRSDGNNLLCPSCKKQIKKEENIEEYTTNREVIKSVNSYFNIHKDEEAINNKPIKYSIIILGNSGVGKTCIYNRLFIDKFDNMSMSTVGVDIVEYYVKLHNKKYELFLCDTAGEEIYRALTKQYYKNADGAIFVFDLTNEKSLEDIEFWYNSYKELKEEVIGVLIGNKSDIEDETRVIKYENAKSFAEKYGLKYFEVSAKTDKYIKKAIVALLNELIESRTIYNSLSSVDDALKNEIKLGENGKIKTKKNVVKNEKLFIFQIIKII